MRTRITLLAFLVSLPMGGVAQDAPEAFDVTEATITELQAAMEDGTVTAVQLVDAYLARIAAYDQRRPTINAIIRLNPRARAVAAELDAERARVGPRGPLHGIPILLKDNFDTADIPTSGASIALAGVTPSDDAFQVRKLREAGAIVLGKTNLHELAAGITTISSLGGQTRNPYDPTRYPGGSSGGTGAAIAASFAAIGWGSDTCGSIRIPAAFNNLVGLRPTKGLSSTDGVIPLSHTQDVAGPLARTVTDLAIGLDASVGFDPNDPTTAPMREGAPPRFVERLDASALRGRRLGRLAVFFGDAPEEQEISDLVGAALDTMAAMGATVVELDIPDLDTLLRRSSVIGHEFKFDLADYLATVPATPVASLEDILDLGLHHAELETRFRLRNEPEDRETAAYGQALARQATLRALLSRTFDEHQLDALVYPTMRRRPARIGEPQPGSTCQLSASTGYPALSMPVGFTDDSLPVGVELLGAPFRDPELLALGYAFEQRVLPRRPPFSTPPLHTGPPEPIVVERMASSGGIDVRARFTLEPWSGLLEWQVAVGGAADREVLGIAVHRLAENGGPGPVLLRISGPGITRTDGATPITPTGRRAFTRGTVYLTVYTTAHPTGALRVELSPGQP